MAKRLALSTMFAQQDRFHEGAVFARFAAEAGYDAIEISHSTPEAKVRSIVESAVLPAVAVHSPAPYVTTESGRGNGSLNLAALDEGERLSALEHHLRSLELAVDVGAGYLVVHLGYSGAGLMDEERELRRLFAAGETDGAAWDAARSAAHRNRAAAAEPHWEAAARSLATLVEAARPHGVLIGLESRLHFNEIPLPAEFVDLARPYAESEVGYWHDTGHVEVLHRLGLVERDAWLEGPMARLAGAHLTDVRGIDDHLAPGDGTADWAWAAGALGGLPAYTLEINQRQGDERVRAARPFLASVGLA